MEIKEMLQLHKSPSKRSLQMEFTDYWGDRADIIYRIWRTSL